MRYVSWRRRILRVFRRASEVSLNTQQREHTRAELAANLSRAGWSTEKIARGLGISTDRVEAALAIDGAAPEDVWLVRDALEIIIRSRGENPLPYTSLSESARSAARSWFSLRSHDEIVSLLANVVGEG